MAENQEAGDQTAFVKLVQFIHIFHLGTTLSSCFVKGAWDQLNSINLGIVDLGSIEPVDQVSVRNSL